MDALGTAATRRRLLRAGVTLGLIAGLQATVALADDDEHDHDDQGDHDEHPPAPPRVRAQADVFSSDLVTAVQASSFNDFNSGNQGTDPLANGRIALSRRSSTSSEGRAVVALRGAASNASYDVFFQPFNTAKPREGLGTIGPTNEHGDLNAQTPNAIAGINRIGVFVLARSSDGSGQAGKDQFVSSLGG
jgi:hypothetical protein